MNIRDFELLCPFCYSKLTCDFIADYYYCLTKENICNQYRYRSFTRIGSVFIDDFLICIHFQNLRMKISEFYSNKIIYIKKYNRNNLLNFYNSNNLLK